MYGKLGALCTLSSLFALPVQAQSSDTFGLRHVNDTTFIAFRQDEGWTADFQFMCVDGDCRAATLNNGFYERSFSPAVLGTTYSLEWKVQDDTLNQVIENTDIVFTSDASGPPPTSPTPDPSPDPSPDPTPPAQPPSSSTLSSGDIPWSTRVENGVVISETAERFRVRHELSFADFNNFNIEYWLARFGSYEVRDYTRPEAASQRQSACGSSDPCVVVILNAASPIAVRDVFGNVKPCNQQAPNLRYSKVYGSETNFDAGYVMDVVTSGGAVPACQATADQLATSTTWRGIMQPSQFLNVDFSAGNQIEFETTISFSRAEVTGDNVNYYGQTFRYVLGEGFTVNNQDNAAGPLGVNDALAFLGGATTVPHLSDSGGDQRRLSYMQHAYNIRPENIGDWLFGRRLFHTNFENGDHIEQFLPGPQAINGNLGFPEQANKATNAIQPSCISCHVLNGSGPVQNGQTVTPPKIIGMGLLEAIPDSVIEGWANENGGRVNRVNFEGQQRIGRFGWNADAATVRHQVADALFNDMGVETTVAQFGSAELSSELFDQLVAYTALIAVPTPRANLTTLQGHTRFQDFGCASCHRLEAVTGASQFAELSNQTIHPYTDLLLHDLGEGEFRTAPLWGVGYSGFVINGNPSSLELMHDGASTSFDAAIQRHRGDAMSARDAYNNASNTQRQQLIDYLSAL